MRAISRMRCATRYLNRAVTTVSAVSVVSTLHIFKFSHFYREIMEEFNSGDEVGFSPDDASNAVKECIEGVIGGVDYSQNKVNQWTASIVEHSLTQLVKQGKAFKYIVNCAIMQKSGAGLHTANSCYWDTTTDGSCTVRWENRTMYCVVSVFAVAL